VHSRISRGALGLEIDDLLVQVGTACTDLLSKSGIQWIPGGLAYRCLVDIVGSLKKDHPYRIDALSYLTECLACAGEQINFNHHHPWFQDILVGSCSAMKSLDIDDSHYGEWIMASLLKMQWQMPSEGLTEVFFVNIALVADSFADLTFSTCAKTLPGHLTDSCIARYYALVRSTLRFENPKQITFNFGMTLGALTGMFVGSGSIQRNGASDFRKSILSDILKACQISCEREEESMKSCCAVSLSSLWKHCRISWTQVSMDCLLSSSLQLFCLGVEQYDSFRSCSLPPNWIARFKDVAQSIQSCCIESFSISPLRFDAGFQNSTLVSLASWAERLYIGLENNAAGLQMHLQHDLTSNMFNFVVHMIFTVTLSGSRMPPLSPFHVLHIFGFLQAWRPVQNQFYGQMIVDSMRYVSQSPADALKLAMSLPTPEEIRPRTIKKGTSQFDRLIGSRIQFLLNAIIPACPILPQETLINNVLPLAFLCLGDNHPPIADAGNDVLCGSFAILEANTELLASIRNDYVKDSFAVAINKESDQNALHAWQSRFDIGLSAFMAATERHSEIQLDTTKLVFTYCEEAMTKKLYHAAIRSVETVLCLLQDMPIQVIPTFCLQIQLFLEAIGGTPCYDQVCTILFQVISSVHDSIRKPYLVEQYQNIVTRSQRRARQA